MDIIDSLGIPDRICQIGARNVRSRAGRQNRLERRSGVDKVGKIGRINIVTRTRQGDRGKIVRRRTVKVEVTEVSRTIDIRRKTVKVQPKKEMGIRDSFIKFFLSVIFLVSLRSRLLLRSRLNAFSFCLPMMTVCKRGKVKSTELSKFVFCIIHVSRFV